MSLLVRCPWVQPDGVHRPGVNPATPWSDPEPPRVLRDVPDSPGVAAARSSRYRRGTRSRYASAHRGWPPDDPPSDAPAPGPASTPPRSEAPVPGPAPAPRPAQRMRTPHPGTGGAKDGTTGPRMIGTGTGPTGASSGASTATTTSGGSCASLRRSPDNRVLGGVCGAVSRRPGSTPRGCASASSCWPSPAA